jgi:phosphate transport system substrate-binding protein
MENSEKNFKKSINWVLSVVILFSFSCGQNSNKSSRSDGKLKGHISISGAFALYPMTVRWAEEFQKENPDVKIDISAGGAGKGMADALSGMVDLGMFSRGVTKVEEDKGAWKVAVCKDAVLPTINAKNPFLMELKSKGLQQKDFQAIFTEQKKCFWNDFPQITSQKVPIIVYTRSDACGAAQMWAEFLGTNQESLAGIGVFGDPGIADAVKSDPNSIGYNNVIYVYDINSRKKYEGLEVVPIDQNQNGVIDPEENFYETLDEIMAAISTGKYPSPPARELYFISNGKPQNEIVIAFIEWILTSGQQFIHEAGYVQLPNEKILSEIEKLKK